MSTNRTSIPGKPSSQLLFIYNLLTDINHATAPPTSSNPPDPYAIGSVYANINEAKEALLQYTVAKELSYRPKYSDKRKYVVECRSESCEFRLRFTIQKLGTAKTTISSPHTCPPETHFGWKQAGGAKYLRTKYRNTADSDRQRIQAAERLRGNPISYMESWRAAKSLAKRARKGKADTTTGVNAVEEAPVDQHSYDNPSDAILRKHEVDAELDRLTHAGVPYKEICRREEEMMAPRYKALEDAHEAWLSSEAQKNRGIPQPQEDKFLTSGNNGTLGLFSVHAKHRR
jgi:hypothetical protein